MLKYLYVVLCFCIFLPVTQPQVNRIKTSSSYPPGNWDRIIDGEVFTDTLSLDTGDDNVLIINTVFHSIDDHAIMLRNVSNIYIKDCEIYDVNGFGILLRGTGSTNNVTIEGCKIYNTKASGVMASQRSEDGVDHHNLVIRNNTIFNNGTNDHEHNIYVQATDSLIENNTVYNSSGNGISIRSTGVVRNNVIWNSAKSCIRYFNDHQPGPSDTLIVEGNFCQLADPGFDGSPGISLLQSKLSPKDWLADNYYVRNNTIVVLTDERFGFSVESKVFDNKFVSVYENVVINTKNIEKTINPRYIDYYSNNEKSTSLAALVNYPQNPELQLPTADDVGETYNYDYSVNGDKRQLLMLAYVLIVILVCGIFILAIQKRRKTKDGS